MITTRKHSYEVNQSTIFTNLMRDIYILNTFKTNNKFEDVYIQDKPNIKLKTEADVLEYTLYTMYEYILRNKYYIHKYNSKIYYELYYILENLYLILTSKKNKCNKKYKSRITYLLHKLEC